MRIFMTMICIVVAALSHPDPAYAWDNPIVARAKVFRAAFNAEGATAVTGSTPEMAGSAHRYRVVS